MRLWDRWRHLKGRVELGRKIGGERLLKHRVGSGMAGFRLFLAAVAGIGSVSAAAAAGPQGDGARFDRSNRELLVAHDAMRNERIDTITRGQVQLLFTDQSSLSVAPGSDVVIDRKSTCLNSSQ